MAGQMRGTTPTGDGLGLASVGMVPDRDASADPASRVSDPYDARRVPVVSGPEPSADTGRAERATPTRTQLLAELDADLLVVARRVDPVDRRRAASTLADAASVIHRRTRTLTDLRRHV